MKGSGSRSWTSDDGGYLLPLEYFHKKRDIGLQELPERDVFAGRTRTRSTTFSQEGDIGAAKNYGVPTACEDRPRSRRGWQFLRVADVPENALALRKDIDPSLRSRLKEILLSMHLDPDGIKVLERFGAQRFIETRNEEYDIIVSTQAIST